MGALNPKVAVNPAILAWARETAGLTREEAAGRIQLRDARGVTGADRLRALERGDGAPTRALLERMAKQYYRPLLTFYLEEPPPPSDRSPLFRTLPRSPSPRKRALVHALVRNLESRHSMVRAELEDEEGTASLPFVGALSRNGRESLAGDPRRLARRAATEMNKILGADLVARYHAAGNHDQAFDLLRDRAEDAGVFVLLQGDLGHHSTAIDADIFRGLAFADEIAPFVVINSHDAHQARSFTLLHELTHLLLGETGAGCADAEAGIERFCDAVAAEWLLPAHLLSEIEIEPGGRRDDQMECISEFAREHNLSATMVALRLFSANQLDRTRLLSIRSTFHQHWKEAEEKRKAVRGSRGGPNPYLVRQRAIGPALLRFARRMVDSRALSTTKAALVLDVKPGHVGRLLYPTRVAG